MLQLGILLKRSLAPAALCALGLAACGSQSGSSTSSTLTGSAASGAKTQTLYIYSSLPHNGPQAAESHQIEQGMRFALDQPKVHHIVRSDGVTYRIEYQALSDSTPVRSTHTGSRKKRPASTASHGWNEQATVVSAEKAARNPETVAFIGDLNSGATQLSLPILNQAGIAQLTPGSGYPGLTDKVAGVTGPGEPDKYYPQVRPSLLRLVPNDILEAAAIVSWLKRYPTCKTVATAEFGGGTPSTEASAWVAAIADTAKLYGLNFAATDPPGSSKTYLTYTHDLAAVKGVNCFVLTGHVTPAAVAFTTYLNAQLPVGSVIVGTDGFCNPSWTDARRGGVPVKVAPALYCTTPVLPLQKYPNGRHFRSVYRRQAHRTPTAYTYYGYLAGSLVLKAIGDVGGLDSRKQVLFNLVNNGASTDLLTYTFDGDGDLSGTAANFYGLDRVSAGTPRHYKTLAPREWLPSAS